MEMFKRTFIFFTLLSALILSGCASVPMASDEMDAQAKAFKPQPGKANLYIYRNEVFGAAIKMPVLINNASVGDTASKTYIYRSLKPGTYKITSKGENDAELTLKTEAGKNYYVWQEIKMGFLNANSQLHVMKEKEGREGVMECKLVK